MSPVSAIGFSSPATSGPGFNPGQANFHIPAHWHNPLPDNLKELDNRKHYLQAGHNRILEMHPNGTRGVKQFTEYCVLSILILNISSLRLSESGEQKQMSDWTQPVAGDQKRKFWDSASSYHVIRGNATGLYLCMDNRSVVYQSKQFSAHECVFSHEVEIENGNSRYHERYFRQLNDTAPRWYLGINPDGSIRCGNVTRKKQKGANFQKVTHGESSVVVTESPPYKELNKKCCTSNSCKHKSRRKDNDKKSDKKGRRNRRCYKNWCRKHRRRFFSLKLKELRRYYNRCVKKIRHCPTKKQKSVGS